MTDQELQTLVEKVSQESFRQPFCHNARFNQRLKTTGGRYHLQSHDLDFNRLVFEKYGTAELIKVIKHELCHYHLHLAGRGYQHKDLEFKQLLKKTGGSRFAPLLAPVVFQVYQCQQCQKMVKRRRKIDTKKYVCGGCQGKLKFLKTIEA
ncbi:SprT family protein [Enterococcus xiangfangensis]|uniref:SprT family protein n=1 Tax=Enterococcus xiangfangensis TaxID=1296537 RepID=A0ABU3FBW3_9ENTE|nr:SprT family protein [Enterococcus xiangfangensis]MBM7711643.1 SprT-like protein [Enterococcus xiangfangensis]MDT2760158.1 SprT family protein [Enterococcus xiangfangensis]NBK07616.1 SprT family protein [Enterococcus asini]